MKKVVVLLVCAVVLLVGDTVLDKSDIESSLGAKKACDSGDMLGCSNLGSRYAIGNGVEKDLGKAVELFKKACDGGNMPGCYNLG
ncbi:MAG: sel1 repeat family protein, partial [Campylobacter sp.]|uniref:tetratricopeptide repeat protein n=1 Tax=Campylobacter sp. TaxID=205 RepID=UPI002AA77759